MKQLDKPTESATVVLLRNTSRRPEVLMLQKNTKINYGGNWVFPGGVVEDRDVALASQQFGNADRTSIAKITVARETWEETGIAITANDLQPISNWLTPKFRVRRYNTLFFVAVLASTESKAPVVIDQQEIIDSRWLTAEAALAAHASGSLELTGPSYVTLSLLRGCPDVDQARRVLVGSGVDQFEPRGLKTATGFATLYHGDCAYHNEELDEASIAAVNGPQHRLFMHQALPWEYIDSRDQSK